MASVEWICGVNPIVVPAEEGSTQSYKAGDLVKWSSGQLVIATAGAIDGIARRDASGTQHTVCEVELINLDSVYSVRNNSDATSIALVGDITDFTFTAGAHTVDEDSATTDAVIVALDPRDVEGTAGGRLYIKFLAGATLQA